MNLQKMSRALRPALTTFSPTDKKEKVSYERLYYCT
jgi:hypothetical protein